MHSTNFIQQHDVFNRLVKSVASVLAILTLLVLAACNTPTQAVDSVAETAQQGAETAADEEKSNIIRQPPTVSRKGTNIRALVNGEPITNYDLNRRTAFLKLRRTKGNRSQKALEELVDEKIKMQEARRRNVVASDSEVNAAFANFAKSNRMSTSQLSSVLSQAGVSAGHFKQFIRGQISWNRAVGSKFRQDIVQNSQQNSLNKVREAGGQKPETTEYLLEQVIFVVPSARRSKSTLAKRRAEANAFRKVFTACGETMKQAAAYRDVTVRTLPRTLEPRLPALWEKEVIKTQEGQTTTVKDTDRGVEFLAVCSRKLVSDDQAAQVVEQQKEFESFNEKGDELANSFLGELKSKSRIIYR